MSWDMIEEMRVYGSSCNNIYTYGVLHNFSSIYVYTRGERVL